MAVLPYSKDGKPFVKSGAPVSGDSGCTCCGSTPPDCSLCSSTPATYTVTFSGVNMAATCQACAGFGINFKVIGTINGTYTFVRTPILTPPYGSCIWTCDIPITVNLYSDTSCTTLISSTVIPMHGTLQISDLLGLPTWILSVLNDDKILLPYDILEFQDYETFVSCTDSFPTFSNISPYSLGCIAGGLVVVQGGTATMTTP